MFLPAEFHGPRSQEGYSPWGHQELGMTEWFHFSIFPLSISVTGINIAILWQPRKRKVISFSQTKNTSLKCWGYPETPGVRLDPSVALSLALFAASPFLVEEVISKRQRQCLCLRRQSAIHVFLKHYMYKLGDAISVSEILSSSYIISLSHSVEERNEQKSFLCLFSSG